MTGGAYVLVLWLPAARKFAVGSLGVLPLPAGAYAFAGGARTGMEKRADRHREKGKPVVAHVDALVEASEHCGDVRFPGAAVCEAADHLARAAGAVAIVGFGVSGCACLTHLYALPGRSPEDVRTYVRGWRA